MSSVTSLAFFARLRWLDGRPLLDTIEQYRRDLFRRALDTFKDDRPVHNLVLAGRGKKNAKTLDLVLAALYCLVIRRSPLGNACLIAANDEDQAADDLSLARKLVEVNPDLLAEVEPMAKELRLRDGSGSLKILAAGDVAGAHGKSYAFLGLDEIHAYRDWALLEALQPDPTRMDSLVWITTYDTIYNVPGVPLHDLKAIGKAGTDPRMLFSWYSGDLCTDIVFAELAPEARANPSMSSWPDGAAYLEQQRRRLPSHRFRRLHLNLPGAPEGAFLDQGKVLAAIVTGRQTLPPEAGRSYRAFVDMSGGSADDAVLAIGHGEGRVAVVDLVAKQAGSPPFNPRSAVAQFSALLKSYGCGQVTGDAYAGQTFREDFAAHGISYAVTGSTKTVLYESLEPAINAGEVELPDLPVLQEQLVCLVVRGARIDHEPNGHDDFANAVAGAVHLIRSRATDVVTVAPIVVTTAARRYFGDHPDIGSDGSANPAMRSGGEYRNDRSDFGIGVFR